MSASKVWGPVGVKIVTCHKWAVRLFRWSVTAGHIENSSGVWPSVQGAGLPGLAPPSLDLQGAALQNPAPLPSDSRVATQLGRMAEQPASSHTGQVLSSHCLDTLPA